MVLGLNRRNSRYLFPLNPEALLPIVDEKLVTKERLQARQIPVPATYGVVRSRADLKDIPDMLSGRELFVIKPARGSGGGGIVVCTQPRPGEYRLRNGVPWTRAALLRHVDEILSGVFALDERPDTAFFEECIQLDQNLPPFTGNGIPDIRFLVVRGVPILSMLRLPTVRSDGRANLHVGGVGVGVDLLTGTTRRGIYRNFLIRKHPDTKVPLEGFRIPEWERMLAIAATCYEVVPLGYLGVDIVLDVRYGPLVLELNARPGLQIQLANGIGLRPLLDRVLAAETAPMPCADRIALGKQLYAEVWKQFTEE